MLVVCVLEDYAEFYRMYTYWAQLLDDPLSAHVMYCCNISVFILLHIFQGSVAKESLTNQIPDTLVDEVTAYIVLSNHFTGDKPNSTLSAGHCFASNMACKVIASKYKFYIKQHVS